MMTDHYEILLHTICFNTLVLQNIIGFRLNEGVLINKNFEISQNFTNSQLSL